MFVIPALAALFAFVYLRPHEVFEVLGALTFNTIAAGVIFAWVLDRRLSASRFKVNSSLGLAVAYFGFSVLVLAIKAVDRFEGFVPGLLASLLAFLVVSQGIRTLRALEAAAMVLLAITLLLAVIGVQQGLSSPTCFAYSTQATGALVDVSDGRYCQRPEDCQEGGLRGTEYLCEHPGLFGTHAIGGRVRYRGYLQDPNELAWVVGMGAPLAFALYQRRRSALRFAGLLATLVLGATCIVMTKSRSGQLTFAVVLGVYFVRRFGWKGAMMAALASAPVLLLGGRSGTEADESTEERLDAWSEGFSMWRENPFLGVGPGQFTEHHYLTAHSSLVLSLAEIGPVGLVLWTAVVYYAFKVALRAQAALSGRPEAAPASAWATAVLASLAGMVVSAAFLSIANHPVLWIFIGLAGALGAIVSEHDPEFRVPFGWVDLGFVIATDVALVSASAAYVRLKGH